MKSHWRVGAERWPNLIYILISSLWELCEKRLKAGKGKRGRPVQSLSNNPGKKWQKPENSPWRWSEHLFYYIFEGRADRIHWGLQMGQGSLPSSVASAGGRGSWPLPRNKTGSRANWLGKGQYQELRVDMWDPSCLLDPTEAVKKTDYRSLDRLEIINLSVNSVSRIFEALRQDEITEGLNS